ncbi:hypothetical protein HPB48_015581 [Haemaphysalis longicornis]|uniref:Transposable element P transposase-like RNase H domain-containing protein n=1 Tax=Haemaphysalis longicornis TaxID=44386 RepID=A0A9J6FJG1_HAELO|nr:hypothetical protein HPB48_015581 [Haemaphysalis longicornis]
MRAKLKKAKISISQMKAMNEQLPEKQFSEKIKGLPSKQQAAVRACFEAARRKSTKGMKYRNDWLLECILMRMRSPQLYEHLRRHEILVLPGRSCIRKAMQHFKSGLGFNPSTFDALREKTKTMDDFSRHGLIVFRRDETFREHRSSIEGFVDLGGLGEESSGGELADHGLAVVFQPFTGQWMQILGVFASRGNVKAAALSKVVLEATLLCEQAGLFVDGVTCDAASWNRSYVEAFRHKGYV